MPWLALAALLAAPLAARAAPPEELTDAIKYLHREVYQPTPERRADWEAARFTKNGVILNLGSVTTKEFEAIERGQLNLGLAPWLELHADVRNDRDRQGSVQRLVVDLMAQVGPGLWLGVSGSPAARKDQYSIGGGLLFTSDDRSRYASLRLVSDSFLYNQLNLDQGTRASQVLHAQLEARWASGPLSLYGFFDATTPSDISFEGAPLLSRSVTSRGEGQLHARYATLPLELDARVDLTALRDESVSLDLHRGLRRTLWSGEAQALFAPQAAWAPDDPLGPFRLRLALRLAAEQARGDESGEEYRYSRLESGMRLALFWRGRIQQAELGYAWAAAAQERLGDGPDLREQPYQDKGYVFWELAFSTQIHMRVLAAWEFANHHFGGGNGSFLALF